MPNYIIKHKAKYFVYSTIVDAPTTYMCTKDQLKEYLREKAIKEFECEFEQRMKRVEEKGNSCVNNWTNESLIACNRAGENDEDLTLDQIYEKYQQEE